MGQQTNCHGNLKKKLAVELHPGLSEDYALRKLKQDIITNARLLKKMLRTGYDPSRNNSDFTPHQVALIRKYLG